ncbi:class I SAM-dependent DNA methyltransferase [bacterium]|nr:class I SAM-dependent DNA methyltransferase [bacterium]
MPLSWNEIRARAARFAADWQGKGYEKGDTASFYHDFFHVFGRARRDVNIYFEKRLKLGEHQRGFIDLFWPGVLLVEQKSMGKNLVAARVQATDYFLSLKEREKPRYILLSDFQTFELLDLDTGEEHHFTLSALPEKIRLFGFIAGYQQQAYKDQDPVNVEAAGLMSNLHNKLAETGYTGAHLERLLVRIMFCLFADDTGIFERDSFLRYIEDRTSEDGSDLGQHMIHLFQIMDTPEARRSSSLDEDLARFPYVNGQLFAERIDIPSFDAAMREALLTCCYFDWSRVSPALFGSLFQTVMLPEEQRKKGAHYTSEKNILKTIHPLFLDELQAELAAIKADKSSRRQSRLEAFHTKLGTLTFMDPACGCGNFLILAYRELRLLEIELLEALYPAKERQRVLDIRALCKVDVDQFYGIELEEFPARIAEAAMWLVDHQMNMLLSSAFGQSLVRLPLKKSAHITHGNALEIDWKTVIAPENLNYMLGNPPFVGSKYQSVEQREELATIFAGVHGAGVLDYVSAWFWKAAHFIQGTKIIVALVSTNSITQGEQVGVLWQPMLQRLGIHIHFAHRTFKWTIDEKRIKGLDIAAVHVVIIGFAAYAPEERWLFDYDQPTAEPHRIRAANINPYLVDAVNVVVTKRSKPICNAPEIGIGNKPIDGGHYLFTTEEKAEFLVKEPQAAVYFRRWLGSDEFINGWERWCLWLGNCPPEALRQMPEAIKRVEQVRKLRSESKSKPTNAIAATPTRFHVENMPSNNFLIVPKVSSERRYYIPIGLSAPETLCSDLVMIVSNATLYHFGILTSLMHNAWMRQVCGRLESRYRYSNTLVYNNFPWPTPTEAQQQAIEAKAQAVLDARAEFPHATMADLYDPLTMPPALLKAHQALDKAVDAAYRKQPFANERERVEFLFAEYQRLTAPLDVPTQKKKRKTNAA